MQKSCAKRSRSREVKKRSSNSIAKTCSARCSEAEGFWVLIPRSVLRGNSFEKKAPRGEIFSLLCQSPAVSSCLAEAGASDRWGVVGHCCGPGSIQAGPCRWRGWCATGSRDTFPSTFPIALVEQLSQLRPEGAQVVGMGDGAYEVRTCNTRMEEVGRASVCCTECRLTVSWEREIFRLDTVGW